MDALSRLLSAIGANLGKGLTKVGETELERQAQERLLRVQQEGQLRNQQASALLQAFTNLLNTPGIQELEPEAFRALQGALGDLALGNLESPNVRAAVEAFPRVVAYRNQYETLTRLASNPEALALYVYRSVQAGGEGAQRTTRLLQSLGLDPEALRREGAILDQAKQLGLEIDRAKLAQIQAQTNEINTLLDARLREIQTRTELTAEELNFLRQSLPARLQSLLLEVEAKRITTEQLPERLKAETVKLLAEAGLDEARAREIVEQLDLNKLLKQAQIGLTKAQTRVAISTEEYQRALTKKVLGDQYAEQVETILEVVEKNPELTREQIAAFAQSMGLDTEKANLVADVAVAGRERRLTALQGALLQARGETLQKLAPLVEAGLLDPDTLAKNPFISEMFKGPDGEVDEEALGKFAASLSELRGRAITAQRLEAMFKLAAEFAKFAPPPDEASRKQLIGALRAEATKLGLSEQEVNAVQNLVLSQWAAAQEKMALEKAESEAKVQYQKALTEGQRISNTLAPKKFDLEVKELQLQERQFLLEDWYKRDYMRYLWAKLGLEAQTAGMGGDVNDQVKALNDVVKALEQTTTDSLNRVLQFGGLADCAVAIDKSAGYFGWVASVRGVDTKCTRAVGAIWDGSPEEIAKAFGLDITKDTDKFRQLMVEIEKVRGNKALLDSAIARRAALFSAMGLIGEDALNRAYEEAAKNPPPTQEPPPGTPSDIGAKRGLPTPPPIKSPKETFSILKGFGLPVDKVDAKDAGAMVFLYGIERGPQDNPLQIKPGSGVDIGRFRNPLEAYQAAMAADPSRSVAKRLDSAIVMGPAWIFPNIVRNPSVSKEQMEKQVPGAWEANPMVARWAQIFKSPSGKLDGIAFAAGYTTAALIGSGVIDSKIVGNELFRTLMRELTAMELSAASGALRGYNFTPDQIRSQFLDSVRKTYQKNPERFGKGITIDEVVQVAAWLFDTTRLSNIGKMARGAP